MIGLFPFFGFSLLVNSGLFIFCFCTSLLVWVIPFGGNDKSIAVLNTFLAFSDGQNAFVLCQGLWLGIVLRLP